MKNIKKLAPIIIIAILALSWYTILNGNLSEANQYKNFIEVAEQALKDDLPSNAIENIEAALEINAIPDPIYMMADYYMQKGDHDSCINWCEAYLEQFKKETRLYGYLCKEYIAIGEYDDCIGLLETISATDIYNKELREYYNSIKYNFEYIGGSYDYISSLRQGYCVVKNNGKYGTCDSSGQLNIRDSYLSIGGFSKVGEELRCTAIDSDGVAWLLDETGNTKMNITSQLNSSEKYKKIGVISDNVFAICDSSDKYSLINATDFSVIASGYDYIGTSTYNLIPVQNNKVWFFINTDGQKISEKTYNDIKINEYGMAFLNQKAFVNSDGSYYIIDINEAPISDLRLKDCKAYLEESDLTAACKDNLWGFVNNKGNYQEGNYIETMPYKNGYAAINESGKWGFIDKKGIKVVNEVFDSTNGFASNNTAVVKSGDKWQMVKFYISESLEK